MGSQQQKKKGTLDQRNIISEIKQDTDMDATRTAILPKFEIGYSPLGINATEYIRVLDRIDRSSQTCTAPFNTTTLNLWLKLNGNYIDYSNEVNDIYPHVFQRNKAFMAPGKFGAYCAQVNWPTQINPGTSQFVPDRIQIPAATPTALDFTTGFSFSFWLYPKSFQTGTTWILWKVLDSSNICGLTHDASGNLSWGVKEAGVSTGQTKGPMTLKAFNHVGVTYNASTNVALIYLNKVVGSGTSGPTLTAGSDTDLFIGCADPLTANTRAFMGGIDEFMYIKAAVLSQTNINNLHDSNFF